MFDVQTTELFDQWLSDLTNRAARARITSRIDRLSCGNAGDVKAVGEGVSENEDRYRPGIPSLLQTDWYDDHRNTVRRR
jgi:putative addiction module killer protein